MKLEADYKKEWVDSIVVAGGYAKRIEDQFRVGFPDLVTSIPRLPRTGIVIIEAKRFGGGYFEPRPRQWLEMDAIEKGGGSVLMLGFCVTDNLAYLARHNVYDGHRGRIVKHAAFAQATNETYADFFRRFWIEEMET